MRKFLVLLVLSGSTLAWGGAPSEGVPLVVRRGFFTETDIGGFMTLGGKNAYSNLQTYLQLGVGYDVSKEIELGLHVGIGSNAANCWSEINPKSNECVDSDSFTLSLISVTGAYLIKLAERFYLAPKLAAGYTLLEPAPVYDPPTSATGARDPNAKPIAAGPHAGLGVGIEYATSMDHFSIGLDVLTRYVIRPNMLTLSIFPRVKYTF